MNGKRDTRPPPALPEEAGSAIFPPSEYVAKDADGNDVRMVPVWRELRRLTKGCSLSDLDVALGLEAGSLTRFTANPDPSSFERTWQNYPPVRIIHPLYDNLGVKRPPLVAEVIHGAGEPKEGDSGVCTHIGTYRERSLAKARNPSIEWQNGEYRVTLPVDGDLIRASWRPTVTSVVRIREVGTDEWSPGFETPLNGCSFIGLKPNTEYELKLTHKKKHGEGPPFIQRLKTDAEEDEVQR